jgi:hypothetical protein
MLGLVISPNLLQVYVFWELVGMCSYLLIGFWYDRKAAADACQKAFVTNRVGDFGLLLGMLAIFWATGSFDFDIMGERLTDLVNTGTLSGGYGGYFCRPGLSRSSGEVGSVSPACLATRRYGRSYSHLRSNPCGNHGGGRGVPGGSHVSSL